MEEQSDARGVLGGNVARECRIAKIAEPASGRDNLRGGGSVRSLPRIIEAGKSSLPLILLGSIIREAVQDIALGETQRVLSDP